MNKMFQFPNSATFVSVVSVESWLTWDVMVKKNLLPLPTSLLTHMLLVMRAMRCLKMDSPKPVPLYSCGESRGVNRIWTEMTQKGHALAVLLGVLLCLTVTCLLICVIGPLFLNIVLGDFELATFVVGEFVSVQLALASRVKGHVVE